MEKEFLSTEQTSLSFDKIKNAANECHKKLGNSEWNIGTAQAHLKKIVQMKKPKNQSQLAQ